jgi:branched-subunit amino acid ABC-type transport system permease component
LNDFKREMKSMAQVVEQALVQYLPQKDEYPSKLYEAMHYSTLSGGKRLRPILVMKAAEFFGIPCEKVMPTACGVEMIHTYSLIHDDLPIMDNDDFRRGKPTCHKVYGDALALLAGDALLTHAFATIAKNSRIEGILSDAVVDVIEKMSLAAGSYGMIGGQTVDIASSGKNIGQDTLFYISTIGPRFRSYPRIIDTTAIEIFNLNISIMDIYAAIVAIAFLLLLTYLLEKTKIGIAIRAASFDLEIVGLMGVNTNLLISIVFLFAGMLAGLAGEFLGIKYTVYPQLGFITNKAYIAAVFGGLGNLKGAVIGSILLGLFEAIITGFVSSAMRDIFVFLLLILVLLIKPSGLMGVQKLDKV